MPVSREEFDAHLAAQQTAQADLITADNAYIAAVDAFIQLPPVIDLAAEDETVNAGLQNLASAKTAVDEARSRIPQPPSPNP